MCVILKIVVNVHFYNHYVPCGRVTRKKKVGGGAGKNWPMSGVLKLNIPSCLTGNAQVISRLKIGRIYLLT